jgi:hypothetical protein
MRSAMVELGPIIDPQSTIAPVLGAPPTIPVHKAVAGCSRLERASGASGARCPVTTARGERACPTAVSVTRFARYPCGRIWGMNFPRARMLTQSCRVAPRAPRRTRAPRPAHRAFLARWLDGLRHDAQRPIRVVPAARHVYSVRVTAAVATDLQQIAGLLHRNHAALRGIALTARVLRDGTSPPLRTRRRTAPPRAAPPPPPAPARPLTSKPNHDLH